MSVWAQRIKRFYDKQLWTIDQVKDGVRTGAITIEDYEKITGQSYESSAE
ncbi:XkdX family protein [Paenibacillus senegalensis]|nr:XkdX family protein [Paenibacillus senegalensis]